MYNCITKSKYNRSNIQLYNAKNDRLYIITRDNNM